MRINMLKRILGLLGWLGVALVFAAVAIRFLKPEWEQWRNGLLMAGLGCTLLYMLSQWREIARSFAGRHARFGTLAAASIAVVLAILIAINYLSNRHNKRWDLTGAKQFTLSDQTKKVLQGLQKPVQIKVFARSDGFGPFRERLAEYTYQTKQINVDYVDVEKTPGLAKQYEVQSVGTVVVEYDGRIERATSDGEQEITNAIIKAISGKQHKVYFVEGHGEKSSDASGQDGYTAIAEALKSDNFVHEKLVLAQQKEVPADASVLVVAGPQTDFFPAELEMIKAYLGRGGKILFLLDPPDRTESAPITNIAALLKEWAIEVDNNIVVDISGMGQLLGTGAEVPVAARYEAHPITDRFRLITAYPLARSISVTSGGANGRFAQTLVMTSQSSWAESDMKQLLTSGRVTRDIDKGDKAGPITLAAAVSAPAPNAPAPAAANPPEPNKSEPPKPETRIVVFGDSDFASNRYLGIPGNRDLFLNSINWLAQQENLISIRPRDPQNQRITLTADQHRRINWITMAIIPGLILLAGIQTWWRRR